MGLYSGISDNVQMNAGWAWASHEAIIGPVNAAKIALFKARSDSKFWSSWAVSSCWAATVKQTLSVAEIDDQFKHKPTIEESIVELEINCDRVIGMHDQLFKKF